MKAKFVRISLIALCALLIVSVAGASEKGSLRVKVVGSEQGKILTGVPVTVSGAVMMGTRMAISNENGDVLFINLTPGVYSIKSELEGFKTVVSKNIRVSLNVEAVVHVKMVTANIQETVTVSAEVPEVNTTKSSFSGHVSAEEVESLPIARDFIGYLQPNSLPAIH